MVIHYDDKGKFFTDVISKDPLPATIQTITHRIAGNVYVRRGGRLIDELTDTAGFLAVTNAIVYNDLGEVIYQSEFLTINCSHIVWLIPDESNANITTGERGQE